MGNTKAHTNNCCPLASVDFSKLAKAALKAREFSYSPYSNFRVGAALLGVNGVIYTGCNVESAAYSPTNCAERTALFKAISEGEREFAAIAVAGAVHIGGSNASDAADGTGRASGTGEANDEGGISQFCYPCGVCRQMLGEFFLPQTKVIVVKTEHDYKVHDFSELLPYGFGAESLK